MKFLNNYFTLSKASSLIDIKLKVKSILLKQKQKCLEIIIHTAVLSDNIFSYKCKQNS